MGLTRQFSDKGEYFAMGFGLLAVVIVVISITKYLKFVKRITWLFSAVIGMIIGSGFLIQACLLGVLIYLISRNSENLLDYIHKKPEEMGETGI